MNALFKKLEKFSAYVEKELIKRENYFADRSENWQESVRGDDYLSETESIQELHDSLQDALVNLNLSK